MGFPDPRLASRICVTAGIASFPLLLNSQPASAAPLILNGGFELPVATSGLNCGGIADCQGFNIGDWIGGWTAVGPRPNDPTKTPIIILINN